MSRFRRTVSASRSKAASTSYTACTAPRGARPLRLRRPSRELDKDLLLTRITIPIGVIGVIFESRPDALVQISGLCIKSGNCAILKGGREASNTNQILFHVFQEALKESGLPVQSMALATSREEVGELLKYDEYIDLIIPRGSNEFV